MLAKILKRIRKKIAVRPYELYTLDDGIFWQKISDKEGVKIINKNEKNVVSKHVKG